MDHLEMQKMANESHNHEHGDTTLKDYVLFAAVLLFILLVSLGITYSIGFSSETWMREFMAVFFLVFGIFKLVDLKGFVMSYVGYDIVAKKFPAYAYAYPFIELILALGYFLNISSTNYATVIIMAIGSIGVARELLRGSKIKCACLGTSIKLPLTTVSLIEDVLMGVMALVLIL